MSSLAIKILEKRALGKLQSEKRSTNSDNPYEHRVPVFKNGKCVGHKTEKRPIPEGLSRNDAKILKKVRKRAYRWDMGFHCCCFGFRFGWSSIIGLFPVIGDFADLFMALALIKKASKVDGGLPKRLYSMMFTNIMIDFACGFIPILGDIADLFYRANTRNAWLLDAYLTEKAKALREGAIEDPDGGSKVRVPPELQVAPEDRDLEEGIGPVTVAEPTPVPPAVTPARTPAPMGTMAPSSRTPTPGRNLTGQRTPGLPGRQIKDPRDRKG
ncbi:hypothetical protein C8A03DRAFT_11378 [Achaetomium macrosporum]|uniref:PH domain-containing protein n=1 Tax=Achaetomium macrosporum TaxID=79813 RepID=A0AAN7HAB6_9PEZI|nr:hypothetical protein C8A03DRAFT_11378 [Achaetomium macrosporum]